MVFRFTSIHVTQLKGSDEMYQNSGSVVIHWHIFMQHNTICSHLLCVHPCKNTIGLVIVQILIFELYG
jgi:hypothetical protein